MDCLNGICSGRLQELLRFFAGFIRTVWESLAIQLGIVAEKENRFAAFVRERGQLSFSHHE
jgi:hypothetical protein